jgi:cell division protein FtsA
MANKIIAAVDIGSTKVTAVIATVEEGESPKVIGESSYVSQGIKKGEITGIDEAINAIASALSGAERMAGLTVSSVYISINGKHITSNNNKGVVAVADNEINTDDVMRALESARTVAIPPSREIIHLIPREFFVDQQGGIKDPVGMTGMRLEVDAHIISATSTALHNLEKCVQSIGLRIDGTVFSGWAATKAVLTSTEKELGVMLLDIGGGTTSIVTFEEGAITYSASIPFGGTNVTRDLAAGLRLSLDDAEKVKLNAEDLIKQTDRPVSQKVKDAASRRKRLTGEAEEEEAVEEEKKEDKEKRKDIIDVSSLEIEGVRTVSRKLFNEIIEARMSEIFEMVLQQIDQSHNEARLPAGVVITGGSSMLPGVTQIAKKVFGVPARIGYPRGLEGLTDGISSPAFSTVQGLISHGASDEENPRSSRGGSGGGKSIIPSGVLSRVTGFFKNLLP